MPDLANMFQALTTTLVKNLIREMTCKVARDIIISKYNEFLYSLPLRQPIGFDFFVDYALQQPKYTNNLIEFTAGSKVGYGNLSCEEHTNAIENFAEQGLKPKMAVVWMGESLSSCVFKSVHESQMIQIPINKNSLPDYKDYLKINCGALAMCIGNWFQSFVSKYKKNEYAELIIRTYEAPILKLMKGYIKVNAKIAMDVYIYPIEKNPKKLATLVLDANAKVIPQNTGDRLIGKV
ncbi:unnamed protein product, partial [Strongylus vulgaris]